MRLPRVSRSAARSPQTSALYQRTYSWTAAECDQLLDDLERVGASDGATHFIGSVVYIAEGQYAVASDTSLQVIDGQQRLTTITLLLVAIRDELRLIDPDDPIARRIQNQLLTRPDEDGEARYKLLLTEGDRATLTALVDGVALPLGESASIVKNFSLLRGAVAKVGRPAEFWFNAIERLMVVDISLDREHDDPQLIFESLNSTGVDLAQADLIRNFLLMDLRDSEQRKVYGDSWRPMELTLASAGDVSTFDRFVRDFLTLKTGQIARLDRVYATYKTFARRAGAPDAAAAAAELRRFAQYYAAALSGTDRDVAVAEALTDLNLIDSAVAAPFLLDVLDDRANEKITDAEVVDVVRIVESYMFRRSVCGAQSGALNKIFATLAREIDEERYVESLGANLLLRDGSGRFPTDQEFRRAFESRDVYSYRNRTYLLDRLENHGRRERAIVSDYTIEHVLPQNPIVSDAWRIELGEDWERIHGELLHTIGNLTLTGYNSELSDRSFSEKLQAPGGFRASPIGLNASIAEASRWDETAIRARAAELSRRAVAIWRRPALSDDVVERYRVSKSAPRSEYSLTDHAALAGTTGLLFDRMRRAILGLSPDMREVVRKLYISYRTHVGLVSVVPSASELKLYLRGTPAGLNDPDGRCRDVKSVGHWGVGDTEVRVQYDADIAPAARLIEQVLERSAGDPALDDAWAHAAVDTVIESFPSAATQQALRRVVEAASAVELYPRPYQRALMISPPSNRRRMLVSFRRREDADVDLAISASAFVEFLGVDPADAERFAGGSTDGWRRVTSAEVEGVAFALEDLLTNVDRSTARRITGDRHSLRRVFWSGLLDHARTRTDLHGRVSPGEDGWLGTGAGRSGFSFTYSIAQHAWVVELYIDRGDAAQNLEALSRLRLDQVEIEREFGAALEWQEIPGKRACRIAYRGDGGYRDEDRWPETQALMVDAMIRLDRAIGPRVRALQLP